MDETTTKPYRVKHGKNFFQDGQFVEGGTVVHLNDAQANSFKDMVVAEGQPLPEPEDTSFEQDEDDDDGDDAEGDDTEGEDDEDEKVEEIDPSDESPIAVQRRKKAEKKAAKKAARDAKNKR